GAAVVVAVPILHIGVLRSIRLLWVTKGRSGFRCGRDALTAGKTKAAWWLNHAAFYVVPGAGIEPARLAAGDFESPASTNFTTRAGIREAANYGTVGHMKYPTIEDAVG